MLSREGDKWEDFAKWVIDLEKTRQQLKEQSGLHVSELLFRGQSDANWALLTTLERNHYSALDAFETLSRYFFCQSAN